MALSFTRLSWLWLRGKAKDKVSNGSSLNSIDSLGECDDDDDDGDDEKRANANRIKAKKRKCKSRNERGIIHKDHELVPSDGVRLSRSESDGLDWSIGWLEPHAPNFQSDDSFAVLVPCYRRGCSEFEERGGNSTNSSGGSSEGGKAYMERWLSSLQKC